MGSEQDRKCSICGRALDSFLASYPDAVCRQCDSRAFNDEGEPAQHEIFGDAGDNPVFIDGIKCWRRYRFGTYVTMRDEYDCATIEEFYEAQIEYRNKLN